MVFASVLMATSMISLVLNGLIPCQGSRYRARYLRCAHEAVAKVGSLGRLIRRRVTDARADLNVIERAKWTPRGGHGPNGGAWRQMAVWQAAPDDD